MTWGAGKTEKTLLKKLLESTDHRIRSAALNVLRFHYSSMPEASNLLKKAASDPHGRVRMTAAVTASYMPRKAGLGIVETAEQKEISKTYKQTYDFAREALNRMPAELDANEEKVVQKSGIISDTKNLTTIRIATLVEKMKYDTPNLTVQAGKKVKLIFANPDSMPHNIVLVNPGKADPVAMEALNLGAKGFDLGFVPPSKDIIWASKLLNQSEEDVIEFIAPLKPDEYPYVCTFPGHHILMRGVLKVIK